MIKKFLLVIIVVLVRVFSCYGQEIKLNGKVLCEDSLVISNASVVAFSLEDKRVLDHTTTNTMGMFTLRIEDNIDSLLLEIRHIAFQTDTSIVSTHNKEVKFVKMRAFPYHLDEVEIHAQRVPLLYKDGDVVVNVENFIDKGTLRGVDVLRKLPGVFVNEQNKQILLNGKPVELEINGRKQPLTFDLLKAIPIEIIDQLVLIPNKRAEHEGDGGNAIINVKTKKKFIDGYVGSLDGNYGIYQNTQWAGEAQGNFFLMLMKRNFYLNLSSGAELNVDESTVYDSTFYGTSENYIANKQKTSDRPWATITNMNLSWDVYQGHRINANAYMFIRRWDQSYHTTADNKEHEQTTYKANRGGSRWNISSNVEYETCDSLPYKFKLSYGYVDAREDVDNRNKTIYNDHSFFEYDQLAKQYGSQHILKADFQKKQAQNKWTLNTGIKASRGEAKDESVYTPTTDTFQNEQLEYQEDILSGYLSGGVRISRKIHANMGIRGEFTDYNLKLSSTKTVDENRYWNLLPTLSLSYNLDRNYNTSFSLSSAIGRPSYNLLSSTQKWYTDRYYSRGNPYLQPYKNYTFTWGNTLFRKLNLNIGGVYLKDQYSQVLLDKGNQITESSYMNCFDSRAVFADFSLPIVMMKGLLFFNLAGNGKYGKYNNVRNGFILSEGRNELAEASVSFYFEYWFSSQYRFKIYGSGHYSIVSKTFQDTRKPYAYADFGILYKCFRNKPLYIIAFANDVFNSRETRMYSYYDNNVRYFREKYKTQGYFIGLSLNFQGGKDIKRGEKRKDVNSEYKRFDEN